jgi:hypothetical protein
MLWLKIIHSFYRMLQVNTKINDIYDTLKIMKLMMHKLSKLYTRERISSFEAKAYTYILSRLLASFTGNMNQLLLKVSLLVK